MQYRASSCPHTRYAAISVCAFKGDYLGDLLCFLRGKIYSAPQERRACHQRLWAFPGFFTKDLVRAGHCDALARSSTSVPPKAVRFLRKPSLSGNITMPKGSPGWLSSAALKLHGLPRLARHGGSPFRGLKASSRILAWERHQSCSARGKRRLGASVDQSMGYIASKGF